ncbi:MAG TPA: hypothetical protein VFU47_02355 [Armatimonadota bacterium]|nr:hypothetical protein [Armatimonadota bacterium]
MADQSSLFEMAPPDETSLPALWGSPKQIEWAEKIRAGKLKHVEQLLREWARLIEIYQDYERAGRAEGKVAEARAKRREALDGLAVLERETSAHWWIEHREMTPRELLAEARRASAEASQGLVWTRE